MTTSGLAWLRQWRGLNPACPSVRRKSRRKGWSIKPCFINDLFEDRYCLILDESSPKMNSHAASVLAFLNSNTLQFKFPTLQQQHCQLQLQPQQQSQPQPLSKLSVCSNSNGQPQPLSIFGCRCNSSINSNHNNNISSSSNSSSDGDSSNNNRQ